MGDTEDYSEEATPSAHHESHEAGGDDEISLDALQVDAQYVEPDTTNFDGILSPADDTDQKALDTIDDHGHDQLHTQNTDQCLDEGGPRETTVLEVADAVSLMHTRNQDTILGEGSGSESGCVEVADAVTLRHAQLHAAEHVTGGGDVVANAVAEGNAGLMTGADKNKLDTQMGIHEALPTVHQDAPALILTHKGDASAHHAKYTDAEAEAVADIQIATHAAVPDAHHACAKGTWTPALSRATTPSAHTYITQAGYYTRILDLVTCSFIIIISATTTVGAGFNIITGLPFSVDHSNYSQVGIVGYNDVFSVLAARSFYPRYSTFRFPRPGPTQADINEDYRNATAYLSGTITYMI